MGGVDLFPPSLIYHSSPGFNIICNALWNDEEFDTTFSSRKYGVASVSCQCRRERRADHVMHVLPALELWVHQMKEFQNKRT